MGYPAINTINRTLLIVSPKKAFLDRANSFGADIPDFLPATEHHSGYLIPEKYDETNYRTFIKRNFRTFLEEELRSEIGDSELWPESWN
jgi:hypothetical protein